MKRTSLTFAAKAVFFAFAALGLASACAPDDNIGEGNGGEIAVPSVKIIPGESGEDYLTFTLTPENAAELRYLVVPASEQQYDAVGVMEDGEEADASDGGEYTVSGLEPSTDYLVLAAARNSDGLTSLLASAEMTTGAHVAVLPEIILGNVSVDGTSATFSYTLEAALSASYLCLASGESVPDAETILSGGTALTLDAAQETVEGLSYSTSYTIYAAAENADGYSEVASADFVTGDAPVVAPEVGDFYYSDGTWSGTLDATKTVVGVVFKSGPADSDKSDYSAAGLKTVNGFAMALKDVRDDSDIFSPKTGFQWTPSPLGVTSSDPEDFSGYYNTLRIKEAAEENFGSFSADNCAAAYYAVVYYEEEFTEAPVSSTGWFLPSLGQCREIFNHKTELDAAVTEAGGTTLYDFSGDWYWSSTETDESGTSVYKVNFIDGNFVVEKETGLSRLWKVRPVLAF